MLLVSDVPMMSIMVRKFHLIGFEIQVCALGRPKVPNGPKEHFSSVWMLLQQSQCKVISELKSNLYALVSKEC